MTWTAQQCSSSSSTTSTVSLISGSLHGAVISTITQVAVTASSKLERQPVWAVIQRFRPTLKPLNFHPPVTLELSPFTFFLPSFSSSLQHQNAAFHKQCSSSSLILCDHGELISSKLRAAETILQQGCGSGQFS